MHSDIEQRRRLSTEVSSFSALSSAIKSNANINVVGNITFTSVITISGKTNVTIRSSVGAMLSSDRSFVNVYGGMFSIEDASKVAFAGLGFVSGSASSAGGCISVQNGCTLEMNNVDFVNCLSIGGGAVFVQSSTATLSGNEFRSCSSSWGGAMYFMTNSTAIVSGTNFTECSATGGNTGGGAILLQDSSAIVSDTSFTSCSSSTYGGAIVMDEQSTAFVSRSRFKSTSASNDGGAMWMRASTANILDTKFVSGRASNGGAVFAETSDVNFTASNFAACRSSSTATGDGGGALNLKGSIAHISKAVFSLCYAKSYGGGMVLTDSTTTVSNAFFTSCTAMMGEGGGVYLVDSGGDGSSTVTVSSSDFTSCTASWGGGMKLESSTATLIDLSVASNDPNDIAQDGSVYTCSNLCTPGIYLYRCLPPPPLPPHTIPTQ